MNAGSSPSPAWPPPTIRELGGDATADHKAGVLEVDAVQRDVDFTETMTADIDREIPDLARWLELGSGLHRLTRAVTRAEILEGGAADGGCRSNVLFNRPIGVEPRRGTRRAHAR